MAMFHKVLVANRGAVASRVLRALAGLGVKSVAVYSDADAGAPWLEMADETFRLGAGPARDSYLNRDALSQALSHTGADALHPGYGFLAESHEFAQQVHDSGATFIGPSARWIQAMGHKTRARDFAVSHGLPIGRGSEVLTPDVAVMQAAAEKIGYPVLVKPAGGGGGIGMFAVHQPTELQAVVERASSLAQRGFGNAEVYLERLVERPRHVEIQVLGDKAGNLCHLFERDCSVQRRHQKIIEEAPAPGIKRAAVNAVSDRIARTMGQAGYDNIGTVEMLMDPAGDFSFLEMNTRLQVEHGVTEEITGTDLVVSQIRAAAGDLLPQIFPAPLAIDGHSIQARVYAEDPKRFFPSPGTLTVFRPPQNVRVETGYRQGQEVTPFYDPLLAKVIVHAATRQAAIAKLCEALRAFEISGVKHNIPALLWILESDEFCSGAVHTGLVAQVMARHAKAVTI